MLESKAVKGYLVVLLTALAFASGCVQQPQNLELVADGFTAPVGLVPSPDETGRLFVVDQVGVVSIIKDSEVVEEPFLDLSSRMVELRASFDERGLLGLAFHPDFSNNGRIFVYYSAPLRQGAPEGWNHTSRISEFNLLNENKADLNSEKIIVEIDEPQFNHNAGQLIFGPDGYLYISVGDGGAANDDGLGHPETGNGQDTSTLLGSILRIDVGSEPYAVPSDNPFVGTAGRDEIFAYGFRNPFRMSFDSETDELFVGDVGQNIWEEVNIVERGKNYGWSIKEGTHCFSKETPDESPAQCPEQGLTDPVIEYKNANAEGGIGLSVIGGFVYRGQAPEIYGKYIFGDWSSSFTGGKGTIFTAEKSGEEWSITSAENINTFLLAFGQDLDRNIYILTSDTIGPTGSTGKIYKLK